MLTLLHALQDEDIDHWRAVATAWGFDLPPKDPLPSLVSFILDPVHVAKQFHSLSSPEREAVSNLRKRKGKLPVALFMHQYGEIRAMGPGRRQRETPWLNPVSVAERLWYGGWIGRAFIRSGGTSQEYFFLPSDLESILPAGTIEQNDLSGLISYRPKPDEPIRSARFGLVEDVCTIFAFLRIWPDQVNRPIQYWVKHPELSRHLYFPEALPFLIHILRENKLLQSDTLQPVPTAAKEFLESNREEAAQLLLGYWKESSWQELAVLPDVNVEEGKYDPQTSRKNFYEVFERAPEEEWCTIASFLRVMHDEHFEFLRLSNSFATWKIKDRSGEYLDGMDSWWQVEAALIREYFLKPMYWLGLVELTPHHVPQAFRKLHAEQKKKNRDQTASNAFPRQRFIRGDGTIRFPLKATLMMRYQLARCSDWIGRMGGIFRYRVTPQSLERAKRQGIGVAHIQGLLEKLDRYVPQKLLRAIQNWDHEGVQIMIQKERILKVVSPEAAKNLETIFTGTKGLVRKIDGPLWAVQDFSDNRLRALLIENGFLIDEANLDEMDHSPRTNMN